MFDILFSQLGIKPDEIKKMGEDVVQGVQDMNARLKRIEQKLGIEEGSDDDD